MSGNGEQIDYWNRVAGPKWVAAQRRLDALMAPLTAALLKAAGVRPGEAILDVGCGCGETALRAAEAAGPRGDVLALDVSAPMLLHARARAAALTGAAPIEWREADASALCFATDRDLLLSRFGVMFFADRAEAFRNLRRALKENGRVALLTWRRRDEVEWMKAPADWLAAPGEPAPTEDGGPGPFSMGDGEAVCRLLRQVGFRRVERAAVDRALHLGADVAEAVALLAEHGPAGHIIRDAEPERRARCLATLDERLRAYATPDGVAMGAACWLYLARA